MTFLLSVVNFIPVGAFEAPEELFEDVVGPLRLDLNWAERLLNGGHEDGCRGLRSSINTYCAIANLLWLRKHKNFDEFFIHVFCADASTALQLLIALYEQVTKNLLALRHFEWVELHTGAGISSLLPTK